MIRLVLLATLIVVALLVAACGGGNVSDKSQKPTATKNFYTNGQYKVGNDLPQGEYIAVGTGYIEVASTPTNDVADILINDNIENSRRYVTGNAGEYIKIVGDIKLYPLSDAPKIDTSRQLSAGQYKAGSDISAGEYKIALEAGGYYAVAKDNRKSILKNQFTNEGGQFYTTVENGQYLQIKKGIGEYIGASTAKTEQSAQPSSQPLAAPKVLNLGMTFEQFKVAYRANALNISGVDYNLENAVVKAGSVQDIFQCDITPNVIVQGSIDKTSGLLKETWILSKIETPDDALTVLTVYNLIISVLNSELTAEQRYDLMHFLKMDEHIEELATAKVQRVVGKIKHTSSYLPQGFFMFVASAKDL